MLVPTEETQNENSVNVVLPNGDSVVLKDRYSRSGLYDATSNELLWTIDWFVGPCFLSEDGESLVQCNRNGDGDYGRGGSLDWGVRFFHSGKLIKEYGVADLVDYPSLMPYHQGKAYVWIDPDRHDNPRIQDGFLLLYTSTHEAYEFDIATGQIVDEFRLWRTLAWAFVIVTFALATIVVGHMIRRRRGALPGLKNIEDQTAAQDNRICRSKVNTFTITRFSFGLRSLFWAMTLIAFSCPIIVYLPHIAILFTTAGFTFVFFFTKRFAAVLNGQCFGHTSIRLKIAHWTLTLLAAFSTYACSMPPIMALLQKLDAPQDVQQVILQTVYWPLYMLLLHTSFWDLNAVSWYAARWGIE
jgi:hypothetical protein